MSIYALGGGELMGNKFVRYVYLDESGIGNPEKEPYVVVAGIIVHADNQLKSIEKYINGLADALVKAEHRDNFFFHAKELYNGGKTLDRQTYPKKVRHYILKKICSIPDLYKLPIVGCVINRAKFLERFPIEFPTIDIRQATNVAQAIASVGCITAVEVFMRSPELNNEVATLIYENNDHAKRLIRFIHNYLKSNEEPGTTSQYPDGGKFFPLQKIAETAFFADKNESSILQIADAIAYVINMKLKKRAGCDEFFDLIKDHLLFVPSHQGGYFADYH